MVIVILGCIGYKDVGKFKIVNDIIDSIKYTRILSTCIDKSIDQLGISDVAIFQQDNSTIHKFKYTKKFFEINNINTMQ